MSRHVHTAGHAQVYVMVCDDCDNGARHARVGQRGYRSERLVPPEAE